MNTHYNFHRQAKEKRKQDKQKADEVLQEALEVAKDKDEQIKAMQLTNDKNLISNHQKNKGKCRTKKGEKETIINKQ